MTDSRMPPVHIVEKSKELDFSKASDFISLKRKYENFYFWFDYNDSYVSQKYAGDEKGEYRVFSDVYESIINYIGWLHDALYRMKPYQTKGGLVSCYPTILDVWKGRRVEMKPGRFFKFVYPIATDKEVESLVAELKAINMVPEFDLVVSQEESAFLDAYTTEYLPKRSPRLNNGQGYYLKRLDSSCMQGKWAADKHPAAVYASGDFWIAYTKEKKTGKIGSRVIYTAESASNIYSVDDHATEILVKHLQENDISKYIKFEGKRIKRIPYPGVEYGIYTPYIDGYCYLSKLDDSFMVIEPDNKNTGICCNETKGYTYEGVRKTCAGCGERAVCDHVVLDSYHDEVRVCDSCFDEYVFSAQLGGFIDQDNAYPNPLNPEDYVTSRWLRRNDYVQCQDDTWRLESEVVYVYNNGIYPFDSDEIEEFEGEWYLKNDPELIKLKRGKGIQKIETWGFKWLMNYRESRIASPYLEYTCEIQEVLRDNFQLNENGIAERLPELPGLEVY